jgi:uncharacterized phage protein (TIGR01671 family)
MSPNRFRFRAWNTVNNLMLPDIQNYSCFGEYLETPTIIIMQSTGLLDKNGIEIFEGDIVAYKFCGGAEDDNICDFKSVVKFENGAFRPIPEEYECDDSYYSWKRFDFEVIGNIYQNKELLK